MEALGAEDSSLRLLEHNLIVLFTLHFARRTIGGRVTRLGEFSPIGRLFTFCSFSEITEAARVYKLPFSTDEVKYLSLAKKCVGLHFGRFFQKLIWSP
jgi:hypothetical protein